MKNIPGLFTALFLVLLCNNIYAQDVPYVPTSPEVVKGMLELAQVGENDLVYDLGCGDGRIVVAAARDFNAKGVGVDSNPQRIKESEDNAKANNVEDKVTFKQQNLFETDIKDATVIAIYLLNSVNLKLRPKFLQDLKPGTRVVSHAFDMDQWEPDAHEVIDNRDVYLWIIPANVSGTWQSKTGGDDGLSLDLKQHFQKVNGTITHGGKSYEITESKLEGNKIIIKADQISFEGEADDNRITGTIDGKEFILTRDEATEIPLDKASTTE